MEALLSNEPTIRLTAFLGLFCLFALLETLFTSRSRRYARKQRWPTNLSLVLINAATLKLLLPFTAIFVATWAEERQIGILHNLSLSIVLQCIIACIALDFFIWLQHLIMHKVPILWRLHQVHHFDLELDVSSGLRFHPLEILLSMLFKFVVIIIFGAPAVAVLIFEVLLNGFAMFNHANLRLNTSIEKPLRWFFVTPDMHVIHHSVIRQETDSNYGFNLSIWDRLFKTYTHKSNQKDPSLILGTGYMRKEHVCFGLKPLLMTPFYNLKQNDSQIKP